MQSNRLVRTKKNEHVGHEKRLTPYEVECGYSTSARGSNPDSTNKSKKYYKSDKDVVKIKLLRDPTSQKLDLHELKMALFDNGKSEEVLFFIRNFNMTLETSGMLVAITKIQHLCTLLRG